MAVQQRFSAVHPDSFMPLAGGEKVIVAGLNDDSGIVTIISEKEVPQPTASQQDILALISRNPTAADDYSEPKASYSQKGLRGRRLTPTPRSRSTKAMAPSLDPRLAPTLRTARNWRLLNQQQRKPVPKMTVVRHLTGNQARVALILAAVVDGNSPEVWHHPAHLSGVWMAPGQRPERYYAAIKDPVGLGKNLAPKPTAKRRKKPVFPVLAPL